MRSGRERLKTKECSPHLAKQHVSVAALRHSQGRNLSLKVPVKINPTPIPGTRRKTIFPKSRQPHGIMTMMPASKFSLFKLNVIIGQQFTGLIHPLIRLPSSFSMAITSPANCLKTEAISITESGVSGMACSKSANPQPLA
jgi:hypothetical protein